MSYSTVCIPQCSCVTVRLQFICFMLYSSVSILLCSLGQSCSTALLPLSQKEHHFKFTSELASLVRLYVCVLCVCCDCLCCVFQYTTFKYRKPACTFSKNMSIFSSTRIFTAATFCFKQTFSNLNTKTLTFLIKLLNFTCFIATLNF